MPSTLASNSQSSCPSFPHTRILLCLPSFTQSEAVRVRPPHARALHGPSGPTESTASQRTPRSILLPPCSRDTSPTQVPTIPGGFRPVPHSISRLECPPPRLPPLLPPPPPARQSSSGGVRGGAEAFPGGEGGSAAKSGFLPPSLPSPALPWGPRPHGLPGSGPLPGSSRDPCLVTSVLAQVTSPKSTRLNQFVSMWGKPGAAHSLWDPRSP